MDDSTGCKDCLTITGAILGIIVALITIIQFFFSDSQSFLTAVENFWTTTFLGQIWPGVGIFFRNVMDGINGFARSSSFTPWWTGILIILISGITKHVIEANFFYDDFDLKEVPLLAIPALVWIFVFYSTASIFGIIVFITGFILGTIAFDHLLDELF